MNEDKGEATEKELNGDGREIFKDHLEEGRVPPASFEHNGEVFTSINDVKEYIEDEEDAELNRQLQLILMLKDDGKHVQEFYEEVRSSFSPLGVTSKSIVTKA